MDANIKPILFGLMANKTANTASSVLLYMQTLCTMTFPALCNPVALESLRCVVHQPANEITESSLRWMASEMFL